MTPLKIVVLEPDRSRSVAVARALASCGYECEMFGSARKWMERLHAGHFDLLVLDASDDGAAEIVRSARNILPPDMPILLIARNGETKSIALALAAGASDYLCIPVRSAELKTRVNLLLAHAYPERMAREQAQYGEYVFDAHAYRLTRAGETVRVTRREFDLALLLFRHLDQPLSRATIGEAVWGESGDTLSRTIDTHISRVRSKLQLRPEHGYRLAQVYGYGYRLERTGQPGS